MLPQLVALDFDWQGQPDQSVTETHSYGRSCLKPLLPAWRAGCIVRLYGEQSSWVDFNSFELGRK